jgi:hypothetical protein
MEEREADQIFPDRLRNQAIAAQESDARKEISPKFCERLQQHNSNPDLFDGTGLVEAAGSWLEVDIARTIEGDPRIRSADALRDAFCRRAEGYCREQQAELVADRHPHASAISGITKRRSKMAPRSAQNVSWGLRVLDAQAIVLI